MTSVKPSSGTEPNRVFRFLRTRNRSGIKLFGFSSVQFRFSNFSVQFSVLDYICPGRAVTRPRSPGGGDGSENLAVRAQPSGSASLVFPLVLCFGRPASSSRVLCGRRRPGGGGVLFASSIRRVNAAAGHDAVVLGGEHRHELRVVPEPSISWHGRLKLTRSPVTSIQSRLVRTEKGAASVQQSKWRGKR